MPVEAGDPAPAFQLPDQDGKIVRSDDLRGKPYVLYFYPADDTPGCTTDVGEDGVVRKAWHAVKPDGHAQEVLASLGD